MFGWRFWGMSALFTSGAAFLIGLPTVLIPNSFFSRMTPTSMQDYLIWIISALFIGPVMALAVLYPPASLTGTHTGGYRAMLSTLLSFFSVGCPVCNKIVVLLLGFSGALTIFNPLRPFLGIASILLLATTLFLRVSVLRRGCPIDISSRVAAQKE